MKAGEVPVSTMRKITALLTLSALLSSLLQPVFAAADEGQDRKREEYLNKRALYISDQSVKIEEKEKELHRKEAQLLTLSQDIHEKNVASTVREIELENLKQSLNKGAIYLAADQKELEQDKQLLAARKVEVENQAKDAEEKARLADEKSGEADKRLAEAKKLEADLVVRERDVDDKLMKIDIEKADLVALAAMLDVQSKDLDAKIARLEDDREKLEEAKGIYASKQKELDEIIKSLSSMAEELDSAVKEAADFRAEARENARKLDKLVGMIENQERTIAQLKDQVSLKEIEIQAFYTPNISLTAPNDRGVINWSDGSIRATGQGIPSQNATPSQGKLLARRAAILDLQRNMLETIKGVQIDSKTKMDKLMVESDVVTSAVSGTISGVEIVDENWDDKEKIYTVTGQLRQDKLARAMSEAGKRIPSVKVPKEGRKNGAEYTGLILNVKHLFVTQQKFFRIVDEKGVIVYGTEYADKNLQSRIGLGVYYESRVFAADEKARVGDNPFFIQGQRISSNGEDIVITMSDADVIRHNRIDFRKECKIIIVK